MDPTKTTEDSPCETQLLKFSQNLSNCHLVPVKVNQLKIQKIEANQWIVLSPEHTVAAQKCDNQNEKIPLKGTYLIELPPNCEIEINNIYLRNLNSIKRQFKNINFPKLNFELLKDKIVTNIKPIKLDDINLNEINSVKNALEIEEKKINQIEEQAINFNTINGWTIITYLIIFKVVKISQCLKMAFRLQIQCFICEVEGNPRQMAILRQNDNQKVNIAKRRREELSLPAAMEVNGNNSRLCLNCNRSILEEIHAYEEDADPTIMNLPLKYSAHQCLICENPENIQQLSLETRVSTFIQKGIYIPSICRICPVHLDDNGFLLYPVQNGIRSLRRPYELKGRELSSFMSKMQERQKDDLPKPRANLDLRQQNYSFF
ncbi:unnamed protein product [Ceutorhynchus assimilis]|uniref:Uncharacterized protein n=1 Tax=Ceutorhynchus assimilis TaxID=467358 RepID=A0A9P0GVW3_9CUCU|nr:unnamed protein product [Ceutorhynchus assimilis]